MECEINFCITKARFMATYLDASYIGTSTGPGRWYTKRVCEDHATAEYGVHKLNELPEVVAEEKTRIQTAKLANEQLLAEAAFPGSDDWD